MGNGFIQVRAGDELASTPHVASYNPTTTFSLRCKVAALAWTPASNTSSFLGHNLKAYLNRLASGGGRIQLWVYNQGTGWQGYTPSVGFTFVDGEAATLRFDFTNDNGSSQSEANWYQSDDDGETWDLVETKTGPVLNLAWTSTFPLRFGGHVTTSTDDADLYWGEYWVDGVRVIRSDFSVLSTAEIAAGSFTEDGGATVTLGDSTIVPGAGSVLDRAVLKLQAKNYTGTGDWLDESGLGHDATPSGATFREYAGTQYLWLPGVTSNNAVVPDSAALDISGDLDISALVALDDWTPSADAASIVCKEQNPGDFGYLFRVNQTDGKLLLAWSETGATYDGLTASTVAPTVNDGNKLWIRATLDVDGGAGGGGRVTYYTGGSGASPSWVQLGDTVDDGTSTPTFIRTNTQDVVIGEREDGTSDDEFKGAIYRVIIKDGIDGTIQLDADFTDKTALAEPFSSFTEKSSNAATVTINRGTSGYASTVVDRAMWLFDGGDKFDIAHHADLDVDLSDDFTALTLVRYMYPFSWDGIASKANTSSSPGWWIENSGSTVYAAVRDDLGVRVFDTLAGPSTGYASVIGIRHDSAAKTVEAIVDGAPSGSPTNTTSLTGSMNNTRNLVLGGFDASTQFKGAMVAFVFWVEKLTDEEITQVEEALTATFDGWDGEILATVKNHLSVTAGGELLAVLQGQGATSKEVVGALNELNGTTGVGFRKALRTYLSVE